MIPKHTLLAIFLLLGNASFSQNQKDKSLLVSNENQPSVLKSSNVGMKGQKEELSNEKYIEAGLQAERELADQKIYSDKDLQSREFIIQRSPDIKIIYTPNPVKQN